MRALKMQNALRLTVVEAEAILAQISDERCGNGSQRRAIISATVKLKTAVAMAKKPGRSDGGEFKRRREASQAAWTKAIARGREDSMRNPPSLKFKAPDGPTP